MSLSGNGQTAEAKSPGSAAGLNRRGEVVDERTTRKILIDRALKAAGWSPILRCLPGASYDTAAVEEYARRYP